MVAAATSWLDEFFTGGRGPTITNAATGTISNVATTSNDTPAGAVRFTGVAPTVTGLASGAEKRVLTLMAVGGPLVLVNESASSDAPNRIVTGTGADVTIAQGAAAVVAYDDTAARWRLASGGGGGGGATVANDIAKQGGVNINRVQGLNRVAFKNAAGALPADQAAPPVGGTWAYTGASNGGVPGFEATKPVPPGFYHPEHYGAKGDGVTDDSAAFQAMFDAIRPLPVTAWNSRAASVQLGDKRTYFLADSLIIDRAIEIRGIGSSSILDQMTTRLKFAPGKGIWFRGQTGYERPFGAGAALRGVGLDLQRVPSVGEYQHGTAYSTGDLIYLPQDHEFVYECITAGTTSARPQPAWQAAHAYSPGDLVTPTTPDGHVYRCTTGGTSGGTEPANWSFAPGTTTTDGSVVWTEDDATNPPYLEDWADIALRPFAAATDATVLWTSGQTYRHNDVVRVAGVFDTVFWLQDQYGGGGVAGATPPTSGTPGTTVSDGTLTWTRVSSASYMTLDGTARFVPRLHCGIFITLQCTLEDVFISNATNYAVEIWANGSSAPAANASFWQATRVHAGSDLGGGFFRVRGEDAVAGTAYSCQAVGYSGPATYYEWDKAFYDTSLVGNNYVGCVSQYNGGYCYATGTTGQHTFVGCYAEGGPPRIKTGVVIGGGLALVPWTSDSLGLNLSAIASKNVVASDTTNQSTSGTITSFLGGATEDRNTLGRMSIGVRAGGELGASGLTWSNTLAGFGDGWHVWACKPRTNGDTYASFAVAGDQAATIRDYDFAAGVTLFPRNGIMVAGRPGDTAGKATLVTWRTALPVAGKWLAGDTIFKRNAAAGDYVGWYCTTSGDYAGVAPVWKEFGFIDSGTGLPYSKGGTGLTTLGSPLQVLRTNAGATGMEWATVSGGEANTASNVGAGNGWFKTKTGVDLEFKSITNGNNLTVTSNTNDLQVGFTVSGSTDEVLTRTSGGAAQTATNVTAGSGYITIGASPALSGLIRTPYSGGNVPFWYVRSGGADYPVLELLSGTVTLSSDSFTTLVDGSTTRVRGLSSVYLRVGSTDYVELSSSVVQSAKPIIGLSSPYAVDGHSSVAVNGTITVAVGQYKYKHITFTQGGGLVAAWTANFPSPASDDEAYGKWIFNDTDYTLTLSVSGGTTTLTARKAAYFLFTSAGIKQMTTDK